MRHNWDSDEIDVVRKELKQKIEGFQMTKGKLFGVFIVIMVIVLLMIGSTLIGSNKAGHIIVKQAAWTGHLSAIFIEGVFPRMCGDVFDYPVSEHFYFSRYKDEGGDKDDSVEVTFRNGSVGKVSGSLRYTYPQNEPAMLALHRRYTSNHSVKTDLVRTEVRKLIGMTASLMSPEAAMTQKGLYYQMLQDQIENGQYKTVAAVEEYTDPVTKEKKYRDVVEVAKDKEGVIVRLENPFKSWGIVINQLVVQDIDPDQVTKNMISQRRDAEMKVMVAKADTEKANEERKTVVAQGEKAVAEKEYTALQEKKVAVVAAQREKEVAETKAKQEKEVAVIAAQRQVEVNTKAFEAAEWDKKTAEQIKLAAIERGRGEAEARKLVMEADGALKMKLDTYERVMDKAFSAYAQRHVPSVVMGGDGGSSGAGDQGALQFMQMLSIKAAKDLALDMEMNSGKRK